MASKCLITFTQKGYLNKVKIFLRTTKWHHWFHIAIAIKLQWWTNKIKWKWAATRASTSVQQLMRFYARSQFWSQLEYLVLLMDTRTQNMIIKYYPSAVLYGWCLVVMRTHAYTIYSYDYKFYIWLKLSCLRVRTTRANKKKKQITAFRFNINVIAHCHYVWVLISLVSKTAINQERE